MGMTTFIWIARGRRGKLQIFLSRNLLHDVEALRKKSGVAKVVWFEPYASSREALPVIEHLKSLNRRALRSWVESLNPDLQDLIPIRVTPDGREAPMFAADLSWPWVDDESGEGGCPVKLPTGPRTLTGSNAQPIPREFKWAEHVGPSRETATA